MSRNNAVRLTEKASRGPYRVNSNRGEKRAVYFGQRDRRLQSRKGERNQAKPGRTLARTQKEKTVGGDHLPGPSFATHKFPTFQRGR